MALLHPPKGQLLPPIDDLTMAQGAHRYCFRGDWLPFSVTGIVSDLSPAARKQIEHTKDGPDGWDVRGTSIHAILEQHLRSIANSGMSGVVIDERWAKWADPLLDHWLWRGCTVLAVEMQLCDPLKRVGGSFDFLVRTAQGNTVLGDLKTVTSPAALKSRKPAGPQLGAYVSMLATWFPMITIDKCVTLVSAPGECEVKPQGTDECVASWEEAWERHQAAELMRGF